MPLLSGGSSGVVLHLSGKGQPRGLEAPDRAVELKGYSLQGASVLAIHIGEEEERFSRELERQPDMNQVEVRCKLRDKVW